MTTMTDATTRVTAGVDTHRDQHVVAALDERGGELGVRSFGDDHGRLPTGARLAPQPWSGRAHRRRRDGHLRRWA